MIIAGGGVIYSEATLELENFANATGIPVCETFGGKSSIQNPGDWFLQGIGLEGTPATNSLVRSADVIISVGTRLTDFATASQSIFSHPNVKFVSINVTELDAFKQGATPIIGDAKLSLIALQKSLANYKVPVTWQSQIIKTMAQWNKTRSTVLNPDALFDKSKVNSPETDAVLTQGQLIGLMQESSKSGDFMITAAGGPPGDILKVWDATDGRFTHTEF